MFFSSFFLHLLKKLYSLSNKLKTAIVVHDADGQVNFGRLPLLVPVPQLGLEGKSAGRWLELQLLGRVVKVVVVRLKRAIVVGVVIVEVDLGHVELAIVTEDETAQDAALEMVEGARLENGFVPVQSTKSA